MALRDGLESFDCCRLFWDSLALIEASCKVGLLQKTLIGCFCANTWSKILCKLSRWQLIFPHMRARGSLPCKCRLRCPGIWLERSPACPGCRTTVLGVVCSRPAGPSRRRPGRHPRPGTGWRYPRPGTPLGTWGRSSSRSSWPSAEWSGLATNTTLIFFAF